MRTNHSLLREKRNVIDIMKKIAILLFGTVLFASCARTVTHPGFEVTTFVDYSLFRNNGIEVTDGQVPDGCTPIGQITELIQNSRTYTAEKVTEKRNKYDDDMIIPRSKTIIKSDGSAELDTKLMAYRLAQIVKDNGGKGIAKLLVTIQDADTRPIFLISGIIYK